MLNDCDTNAVVAARPRPVSGGGRTKGQSNFRADEDQKLARAYALVSTDAAVGTDQDCCETFWKKIHVNFIKRGGGVERTPNSLQNRFNKVLQCDVLKYIGFFQSSLREYHSGWQMADYVEEAKKQFQFKMKKAFKHDAVYEILKKARLPKYELELSSVNASVTRALFFLDNEVDELGVPTAENGASADMTTLKRPSVLADNSAAPGGGGVCTIETTSTLITPRPSIGKRKAKSMEFNRHQQQREQELKLKHQQAMMLAKQELKLKASRERSDALNRLAAAVETKNKLVQDQLMTSIFLQNPSSAPARAFFHVMGQQYTSQMHMAFSSTGAVLDEPNSAVPFVTVGTGAVEVTADGTVENRAPDDAEELVDSDSENDHRIFASLPCTQGMAMALEKAMETATPPHFKHADNDDSQATTLDCQN